MRWDAVLAECGGGRVAAKRTLPNCIFPGNISAFVREWNLHGLSDDGHGSNFLCVHRSEERRVGKECRSGERRVWEKF